MKFKLNGEWKELTLKATDTLPIGTVVAFAGTTIPTGWLLCDGSILNPEDYPELYNVIGTTYGQQGGFVLPDYRGRTLVGMDKNDEDFDHIGKSGGEKTHKLTVDEMPSHNHFVGGWLLSGSGSQEFGSGGAKSSQINTNNTGGDQAHNNLQPYKVVNYIIKAFNTIASNTVLEDNLPVNSIIDYDGDTVPDGYEEVGNDYSTDEVDTGMTWIDGKKIYRRVFTFSRLTNSSDNVIGNISNINVVTNQYGNARLGADNFSIPYINYSALEWSISGYVNTDNGNVIIKKGAWGTVTLESYYVVEYTKN